jgi:hypothetical protein
MSMTDDEQVLTDEHMTKSTSGHKWPSTEDYSSFATQPSAAGIQTVVTQMTLNQELLASMSIGIVSLIVFVIFFGNALTIWAVLTTDRLRVKTYALTTSLAAADFLIGFVFIAFVIPETICSTACGLSTYKSAVRPIERLVLYASFLHIPAIAIDRFVAILYPLHYENRMTPSALCRVIAALWLSAAAASLPTYMGFATSVVRPQSCIVTLWPIHETVIELSCYFTSLSIVLFVYMKIWSTAMHHETLQCEQQQRQQQHQHQVSAVSRSVRFSATSVAPVEYQARVTSGYGSEQVPIDEESLPINRNLALFRNACCPRRKLVKKHRATRTIMTLLGVFIVMWFPYMFARFLVVIGSGPIATNVIQVSQVIGTILSTLSYSLNVFIYSLTNSDFRQAFKRILHVGTNKIKPVRRHHQ